MSMERCYFHSIIMLEKTIFSFEATFLSNVTGVGDICRAVI